MVTIVAALLLGLPATMAAEHSFLLAMPTLGAAIIWMVVGPAGGSHALIESRRMAGLAASSRAVRHDIDAAGPWPTSKAWDDA